MHWSARILVGDHTRSHHQAPMRANSCPSPTKALHIQRVLSSDGRTALGTGFCTWMQTSMHAPFFGEVQEEIGASVLDIGSSSNPFAHFQKL